MKKNILLAVVILALAGAAMLTPKFLTKAKNENPEVDNSITLDSISSTKLAAKKVKTAAIYIKDFAFSPANKTITKGTKITWTNNDNTAHTVTSDNKNGPKSQLLNKGSKYSFIFKDKGTFEYYCSVHPSMKGTIIVK